MMFKKIFIIVFVLMTIIIGFYSVISCAKEQKTSKGTTQISEEVDDIDNEKQLNNKRNLIVYFSRYGNTNYPDDIDASTSASIVKFNGNKYGSTEYIANLIQRYVGGDRVLLQTENPYSENFSEVIVQNHLEQQQDYLPNLKNMNINIDDYDVIYIGYPVWATTAPQVVFSFLQKYDFAGKTIIPFCTHDGYGSGSSYEDIKNSVPNAKVLSGIDIEAQDVFYSQISIENWLKSIGELTENEIPIVINIGDKKIDAILYDTALANELKKKLPLTVNMIHYNNREYYGYLDDTIDTDEEGKLSFNNGEITYCKQNNSIAIFYNQSDSPNLTMQVIPIGKVISDLNIFHNLGANEEMSFDFK